MTASTADATARVRRSPAHRAFLPLATTKPSPSAAESTATAHHATTPAEDAVAAQATPHAAPVEGSSRTSAPGPEPSAAPAPVPASYP